jgi:hypothetical protein
MTQRQSGILATYFRKYRPRKRERISAGIRDPVRGPRYAGYGIANRAPAYGRGRRRAPGRTHRSRDRRRDRRRTPRHSHTRQPREPRRGRPLTSTRSWLGRSVRPTAGSRRVPGSTARPEGNIPPPVPRIIGRRPDLRQVVRPAPRDRGARRFRELGHGRARAEPEHPGIGADEHTRSRYWRKSGP